MAGFIEASRSVLLYRFRAISTATPIFMPSPQDRPAATMAASTTPAVGPHHHVKTDVGPPGAARASVRVIAVWEAVKGVLVLLAGGFAVYVLRPDQERSIEEIVGHFHLNPAGHTSHIFQRALEDMQDTRVVLLAVGAMLYALLRFVEAYGLWFERRWGWMLGIASAALYLPLEIREMLNRFTWTGVTLFVLNMAIVVMLWRNRTHHIPNAV
jgi:uncharacterized membrane protein (DUF2068 family)